MPSKIISHALRGVGTLSLEYVVPIPAPAEAIVTAPNQPEQSRTEGFEPRYNYRVSLILVTEIFQFAKFEKAKEQRLD